jgi:hypothetical protein
LGFSESVMQGDVVYIFYSQRNRAEADAVFPRDSVVEWGLRYTFSSFPLFS